MNSDNMYVDPREMREEANFHRALQQTFSRESQPPAIYVGDHDNEKFHGVNAYETTHYYFPTDKARGGIDHSLFDKEGDFYDRLRVSPEKDFPRPDFLQPIWRRLSPDNYSIELISEFKEKTGYGTLEELLDKSPQFEKINGHYADKTLVVSKNGDAFLDVASPEADVVFAIPVEIELDREELEKEYNYVPLKKAVKQFMREIADGKQRESDDEYERD